MALLDAIGRGLSAAGATLNPHVYQDQAAQQLYQQRLRQQQQLAQQKQIDAQKAAAANLVIKAVQSGGLDPNVGNQKLQQLGYGNLAGIVSASPEAKANQQFLQLLNGQQAGQTTTQTPQSGLGTVTGLRGGLNIPPAVLASSPLAQKYVTAETSLKNLNQPKAPPMRTIIQGGLELNQEMQPDGTWKTVGQGPRFKPTPAPTASTAAKYEGIKPDGNGGWVGLNKTTGRMEQVPTAPGVKSTGGGLDVATLTDPALNKIHGNDFLKLIPQNVASQVKALAEGRQAFPSGYALRTPYWQKMIGLVAQYDPTFDAVNYNARSKTRNDFTSGKAAQNINALNTVMGHLKKLKDAANALGNVSGFWGATTANSIKNSLEQSRGDPRITNFNTDRKAVVDELTRVYRQMGGSEQDIKSWEANLNASGSPEQLNGAIAQIASLLQSKINALGQQYSKGMGTTTSGLQLLNPDAQAAFKYITGSSGTSKTLDFSALPK